MSEHNPSAQLETLVKQARSAAEKALNTYTWESRETQRLTNRNIDLYGRDVVSRLAEIVKRAKKAADTLYAALQTQFLLVDEMGRPLLDQQVSAQAVSQAVELLKWLNEQSEISIGFDASINQTLPFDLAEGQYHPTMQNKLAQAYWESRYNMMPEKAEWERSQREQAAKEARQAQEATEARRRAYEEAQTRLAQRKEEARMHWEQVQQAGKEAVESFQQQLNDGLRQYEQTLRQKQEAQVQSLQEQKQVCEQKLSRLGLFKLGEKNACKQEIESLSAAIRAAHDTSDMDEKMKKAQNRKDKELETYQQTMAAYLERRFNYEQIKKEAVARYWQQHKPDRPTRCTVFEAMRYQWDVTAEELAKEMNWMTGSTSSILRELYNDGYLTREMEGYSSRNARYSIKNDAQPPQEDYARLPAVPPEELDLGEAHEYMEDPQVEQEPFPAFPDPSRIFW